MEEHKLIFIFLGIVATVLFGFLTYTLDPDTWYMGVDTVKTLIERWVPFIDLGLAPDI